jgi:hypothetical protein
MRSRSGRPCNPRGEPRLEQIAKLLVLRRNERREKLDRRGPPGGQHLLEEALAGRCQRGTPAPDRLCIRALRHHGPTLEVRCEPLFDEPHDGVWASDHFGVTANLAAR